MTERPFVLRNTRFSEIIADQDLAVFMRVCPERVYPAGTPVYRAGDPALDLHVVMRGQVKVLVPTPDGGERILAICGPDDFIGEAFVSEGSRYRAEAVALTDVVTCPMSREQFMQMSLKAPTFVLGFTSILLAHLFDCRDQLATGYDAVILRVAKVLLDQAERFGTTAADGWVELKTTLKHEDIASMVSATRVSVTMAITELREKGVVVGSRGRYELHAPALRSMVESIRD